jgi:hypothetical protein
VSTIYLKKICVNNKIVVWNRSLAACCIPKRFLDLGLHDFRDGECSAIAAARMPTEGPQASPQRLKINLLYTLLYSDFPRFEENGGEMRGD